MSTLNVITEGNVSTLLYFSNIGLKADSYYIDALTIKTKIPYLTEEDKILIVLQGFTDFTISEVIELFKALEDSSSINKENIIVLSSIKLPFASFIPYFIYKGSIVDGKYTYIEGVSKDGEKIQNNEKFDADSFLNGVLAPFKGYGVSLEELETLVVEPMESMTEKFIDTRTDRHDYGAEIVLVDIYSKKRG